MNRTRQHTFIMLVLGFLSFMSSLVYARTEHRVSNTSELLSVLTLAQPLDTVLLAGGQYTDLNISGYPTRNYFNFSDYVTIKSKDPNNRAVFGSIQVGYSSYIRFENIVVHHPRRPTDYDWTRAFEIRDSDHIEILNSELYGSDDGEFTQDVYGLSTGPNVSNFRFEGNSVHDWTRGTVISGDHIDVLNNHYYNIRSDGADFANVVDALVEGNRFHDFHPCCGDHADMIQFWNDNGTRHMRDVIIRNNIMLRGSADWTQSIFIQSNSPNFRNQNFLIEGNLIYNGHLHGITVYDTDGLTIKNNTVLSFKRDPLETTASINTWNTTDTLVENNVAAAYALEGSRSIGNVTAQNGADEEQSNHYNNLFMNPNSGSAAVVNDFQPRPSGMLIVNPGHDIGALEYNPNPPNLTAVILANPNSGSVPVQIQFDGSLSGGPNSITNYLWHFGDGQTAQGQIVNHTYHTANSYQVKLTVTDSTGSTNIANKTIVVNPPPVSGLIYGLTLDGHLQDSSENHLPAQWVGSPSYGRGIFNQAIELNGTAAGSYINVPYHLSQDGMEKITLTYWARKSDLTGGFVFLKHISYFNQITSNTISGYFFNNNNPSVRFDYSFTVNAIQNTNWHHYAIVYDGAQIKAYVDGVQVGTKAMTGRIAVHADRELAIGKNLWGNTFKGNLDEIRIYNIALNEAQVRELAQMPKAINRSIR